MKLFYKNILKALKKHKNIMLRKKDNFCIYQHYPPSTVFYQSRDSKISN